MELRKPGKGIVQTVGDGARDDWPRVASCEPASKDRGSWPTREPSTPLCNQSARCTPWTRFAQGALPVLIKSPGLSIPKMQGGGPARPPPVVVCQIGGPSMNPVRRPVFG